MMPDLLTSETSNIALEVTEELNLFFRSLVIFVCCLHRSPLLVRIVDLHYQV